MAAQHEDEAERDAQLVRTILRRQGEIVIATFERAARLCPSDPDFHFGVGEMSTYLGRKYQAHRALKRAEELAPVDPQVQAALVHASQAIGHEEERLNRAKLQHKYANRTAAALRAFQNAAEAHDVTAAMKVVDQVRWPAWAEQCFTQLHKPPNPARPRSLTPPVSPLLPFCYRLRDAYMYSMSLLTQAINRCCESCKLCCNNSLTRHMRERGLSTG